MTQLKTVLPLPLEKERPAYLATAAPVAFGDGFYEEERSDLDRFRWLGRSGRITFDPDPAERFLELWVLSEFHDLSQELTSAAGETRAETFALVDGWAPLSMTVPANIDCLNLSVNKLFPRAYYPDDGRALAVRMRPPLLHCDPARHAHIARQYHNAVRNTRELLDGRVVLESTPVSLGIDMYGVCNVKPPCVYCEWDFNKDLEGEHVDTPFTVDTLREWGPFFDNSVNLVNCSIGEPFMMKNFDDLLDAFGDAGKVLETTTNGQILTDRNIQKLLGRPIDLYISLDAGTPETYARLRNDRFESILQNMRRLIEAKGGRGGLPRVHLVFMPMRANVDELEAFVRICADLQVDRLVLRPLNYSPSVSLDWNRAGYRFEYQKELLPFEELVRVSGRTAELCRRLDVHLADQMDFGGSMGEHFDRWFEEGQREAARSFVDAAGTPARAERFSAGGPAPDPEAATPEAGPAEPLPSLGGEKRPVCTEPWKSLYILRRGVFPCCYGGAPLATMDDYRDVWNSSEVQAIRGALAAGHFHHYCLNSPACPIVRKAHEASELTLAQTVRMETRRVRSRVNRITGGWPGRLYRLGRRMARRALGRPDAAR